MATLQTLPETTAVGALTPSEGMRGRLAARSFLYAVFKHRWLVLGVFGVVFAASAVAALTRPGAWLARSKVLVKLGETVQLAPAEAPSRSMGVPLSQDVVRTEVDIVKSWDVVSEAIARLGIEPTDGTSMADLVDGVRRGLSVAPTPGTNMLGISFIGKDPDRAAKLVNTITDVYIEHHNRVYRRDGIHMFYAKELRGLEQSLSEVRGRLRSFLEEADVVDVNQEITLLNEEVLKREKALKSQRAKVAALERKLDEVMGQLEATPETIEFAREYESNPTRGVYERKLAELEMKRAESLQRYLPTDRLIRDLDAEISEVRGLMGHQGAQVLGKHSIRQNDLHRELQRNLYTIQTLLVDARARVPGRIKALDDVHTRLKSLREKRFVIHGLEQDVVQRQYAFDLYWKKREEARISEAMTDQSMVNVSVVEHAQPPRVPQNGLLLPLVLGFLGGLTLATAMAVAVEFLNRRLRFEEEVEHYLELPVLAVIPDFESAPDLANA
jgi:uncharacterized protein involved in exopolysaccharide biosynthesis